MRVVVRRADLLQALASAEGQPGALAEASAAGGGLTLLLGAETAAGSGRTPFAQVTISADVREAGSADLAVAALSGGLAALDAESVELEASGAGGARDFALRPASPPSGPARTRGAAAPPPAPGAAAYASWGSRVGAYLVDAVVLAAAFLVLGLLLRNAGNGTLLAVAIALQAAYFTLSHGSARGQTLGKRAVGIAVRRADTGGRCSYAQALARYATVLAFSFGFVVLSVVDYLWPLRDPRRQALHDKVARTIVVRV